MTNKYLYTRRDWGAHEAEPMAHQGAPKEAFIHHSENGDAARINSLDEQKAAVRAIQAFHMGPERGWSDIAYHYVVFQPMGNIPIARAFAARSVSNVPAAQLNHNTGTLAICVYGDFRTDQVKPNTRFLIEKLLRLHPTIKIVGGHRDVVSTECPGDHLYAAIPRIAKAAGVKTYR